MKAISVFKRDEIQFEWSNLHSEMFHQMQNDNIDDRWAKWKQGEIKKPKSKPE